jgi:hypothetical protein
MAVVFVLCTVTVKEKSSLLIQNLNFFNYFLYCFLMLHVKNNFLKIKIYIILIYF